ncbi:MAG: hypothetical protein SOT81_03430 [Treponema sp.]|nr:hypothetical protein [Treponema sp.]
MRLALASALILSCISLFSCAVDEAEISTASGSLILDYENDESVPDSRLAVFIQTKNSVQRTDSFSAENLDSGYIWNVPSPSLFETDTRQFAYSTNLKAPDGENIPKGIYKIVYNDAAGNSDEFSLKIDYDDKLLEQKASEIAGLISGKTENLAVYDEADELIYFGRRKSGWTSNAAILNEYKIASYTRVCYSTPSNSVICFMPAVFLREK